MTIRHRFFAFITWSLVLLSTSALWAQYTTASLGGVVADTTGATVPDAKITVRNTETGFTQTLSSGSSGAYLFPRLPVGAYRLKVEKEGFTAYEQTGITLVVDQSANIA